MDNKYINGYRITDSIDIEGNNFVLGENKLAEKPYATFEWSALAGYCNESYFDSISDARKNLFERATNKLSEQDRNYVVSGLITATDRANIISEYRKSIAWITIESALDNVQASMGFEEGKVPELMEDPFFMARATHRYNNIDRSDEHAALEYALEDIIKDHYPYLVKTEEVVEDNKEREKFLDEVLSSHVDEKLRAEIISEYRLNCAKEDIFAAMENLSDFWGFHETTIKELLANPAFMTKALHLYDNIDHSWENEALADNLQNIIREMCPALLNRENTDCADKRSLNDLLADAETRTASPDSSDRGKPLQI